MSVASLVIILFFILVNLTSCGMIMKNNDRPYKNVILINLSGLRKDRLPWYGYSRKTMPLLEKRFKNPSVFSAHHAVSYIPRISQQMMLATGTSSSLEKELHHSQMATNFFIVNNENDLSIIEAKVKKEKAPFFVNIGSERLLSTRYFVPESFPRQWGEENYNGSLPKTEEEFEKKWLAYKKDPYHFNNKLPPEETLSKFASPEYNFLLSLFKHGSEADYKFFSDSYDNSLLYLDFLMDKVLGIYERHGHLKESLIILTADSGNTLFDYHPYKFKEGGMPRYFGQYYFLPEVVDIPLIFSLEHAIEMFSKEQKNQLTSSVDLAPTILSGLNLPGAEHFMGKGLLALNELRSITCGAAETVHRGLEKYAKNREYLYVKSETRGEVLIHLSENKVITKPDFIHYKKVLEELSRACEESPTVSGAADALN